MRLPVTADQLDEIFSPLVERVHLLLADAGFEADRTDISGMIDMRYSRQTNTITVPVERLNAFDESFVESNVDRFENLYQERFSKGSGYRDAGIDFVAFKVVGTGFEQPSPRVQALGEADPSPGLVERRRAWVPDRQVFEEFPGYGYDGLRPGNIILGPAIVWSPSTTVVLRAADTGRVDENTNLVIDVADARPS
ncbi:MAG: hypothetical protein GEU78_10260 [Actinobacteria bacterium]|nr:hypothetical protein [Actinomycetota bacterium]